MRTAEAALEQAKAQLEKANQDVQRLRPLAEKDAVPRQDLDTALAAEKVAIAEVDAQEANLRNSKIMEEVGILQATAEVKKAAAAVELAELDLSYCTIKSPLDGLIGRTDVDVGNLVGRGETTELVTVSSIDPIHVTMAISEEEFLQAQRLKESEGQQEVELILADNSVFEQTGRFVTVDRAIALETGTLTVVCEFPNPEGNLRPGQFGRLRVVVTRSTTPCWFPSARSWSSRAPRSCSWSGATTRSRCAACRSPNATRATSWSTKGSRAARRSSSRDS